MHPLVGDVGELLQRHKTLYGAGHTWSPSPNEIFSFESKYYASKEDADAAAIKLLRSMAYKPPRWFEYWRWGEPLPNATVLAAIRTSSPAGGG